MTDVDSKEGTPGQGINHADMDKIIAANVDGHDGLLIRFEMTDPASAPKAGDEYSYSVKVKQPSAKKWPAPVKHSC